VIPGERPRSSRGALEEARAAAEDALAFAAGLDETAILALPGADRRTFRALKDALAEIGERVDGLPPEVFARHPAVDWRGWAGLREVLSRRRPGPELRRLHPVVVDDLPALLAALEAELARLGAESAAGGRTSGAE